MGKLLKVVFTLVIVLVVLVVAAIILIPLVVDPNDYKDEIAAQVKQTTGRDLQIGGKIGLSVFPWLGLELNALKLSNAPGFGETPFAAVEHAQVRAKLLPLLSKRLEVDTVRIEGLDLYLARAEDGRTNWDDLVGETGTAKEGPATTKHSATADAGAGQALGALAVGGVQIERAQVLWDDRASGQRYQVHDIALKTGALSPGQPVDLELSFALESAQPPLQARMELAGTAQTDAKLQQIRMEPLTVRVRELSAEGITGEADLRADLRADLGAQRYLAKGLELVANLKGQALPGEALRTELSADLATDLAAGTFEVQGLEVKSGDLRLSGGLQGSQIETSPRVDGELALAEFNLRQWLSAMGLAVPETADANALSRFSAKLALRSGDDRISTENLVVRLDDSLLQGTVSILEPATPKIRFDLQLDRIDLDRYLPAAADQPAATQAQAAPAAVASPAAPVPLLPVDTLRSLDLQGVCKIGALTVQRLRMQGIELAVQAKDGKVTLDDRVQGFYQGSLNGSLRLNVAGESPQLSTQQKLAKIQAGPLLRDLTGKDTLTGTGEFNLDVTASGQTPEQLTKSLKGTLDFGFLDGAVKGFNLAQMIREAKARYSGKPIPSSDEPNQTDFSELTASGVIAKGVLTNNDLLAKSPYLRITGKGTVDLVTEGLDYTVTPVIVSTEKGQGGAGLEELKGIPVPVQVTGSFSNPSYQIDWKTVVVETQKGRAGEEIDKRLDKALGDKVDEKTKTQLKDVFKGFLR